MKVGINALSLLPNRKCGAESVFFNLVKGFEKIGFTSNLIYFCYPHVARVIRKTAPSAKIVVVEKKTWKKHVRVNLNAIQTTVFHRIYKNYDLDVLFFVNADVGLRKYNIPVIVLPHDIQNVSRPEMNSNKFEYYLNYMYYKKCFSNSDIIVAISDDDLSEIRKYYPFTYSKTKKIYDPIDIGDDDICFVPKKQNYLLAVNIQYAHKNIMTLIKAFSIISDKNPDLKLKLVGAKSSETLRLEKYVKDNKLENKIEFLGFIPRESLISLWKQTRLYINPSLYEGFGMTSVESILFGAPTLLGDLPVNREVTDNLCSYYKDLTNEKELAYTIQSLLDIPYNIDDSLQKAMHLFDKYNSITICNQYVNLFEELSKTNCKGHIGNEN